MSKKNDFNNSVIVKNIPKKGEAVFASRGIKAGEKIGYFEGEEVKEIHMHTIHLEGKIIDGKGKTLSYLSHSCAANSVFKDKSRWLYAKADIDKSDTKFKAQIEPIRHEQ